MVNLKHISEGELLELIKAIFSLAKTLKIWEIRKLYALTSLGLKLKPLVQGLDSQSTEDKARHILEALSLIGTYRDAHREEFDELLDNVFEIAQHKREKVLNVAKRFL